MYFAQLPARRPAAKFGRPTLQSLYEGALAAQIHADPHSVQHIATKEVPPGWKRGMSVLFNAKATFAVAGHTAVEVHQEPPAPPAADPAPADPTDRPAKKRRVRVAKHHVRCFLSLADSLHEDTAYKWKSDEVATNPGTKLKKIPSALAEKMTVMTHDMIKQSVCHLDRRSGGEVVSGVGAIVPVEHRPKLQSCIAKVWSEAKVQTPVEKEKKTFHFVMKIAFLLDKWRLDWTRCFNFDETCLALSPTGIHGWWWKGKDEKAGFQKPTVTLATLGVKAKVAPKKHLPCIMIPLHCTSFLPPCAVGLMRPFKSAVRRTACEHYAKAIFNNTDTVRNVVEATPLPDLRADLVRFDFAWRRLTSFDGTWDEMLEGARVLHTTGQLFKSQKGDDVEEENSDEATALFDEPDAA
eukprot:3544845-Amphidinium_carterae.2